MELNLHPVATKCYVSGRDFAPGDRVVSYLVREAGGEVARRDLLAAEDGRFMPPAFVYCRWVAAYRERASGASAAQALRLTAENLFLTLADPAAEPSAVNVPLLQFLALLLERKRVLRPRGRTADGARLVYEHRGNHQLYEVPAGELDAAFFRRIQEHVGVLVGTPAARPAPADAAAPAG